MKKLNNITRFLLIFLAGYFTLMAIHEVPSVRRAHTHVFNTMEEFTFNLFNPRIHTDFMLYQATEGVPYQPDVYDYSIKIYDIEKWKSTRNKRNVSPMSILNANMDNTGIGPMILFIALMLATPLGWKRKLLLTLLGAFVIYILVALKYSYMFYENIASLEASGLWGILSNLFGGAFRSHEFMLMNVVFVWVLVAIRQKELLWFFK